MSSQLFQSLSILKKVNLLSKMIRNFKDLNSITTNNNRPPRVKMSGLSSQVKILTEEMAFKLQVILMKLKT
jgi:hypothetical protein